MKLLFLSFLLLTPTVWSQDANVIQLSEANAHRAQQLYREQLALDAKWLELKFQIIHDHLEAPSSQTSGCVVDHMLVLTGWGCAEFKYDPSYRFIVPGSLTSAPYDSSFYELVNGSAVGIKEKPAETEDDNGWHWIFNNTSVTENNIHKP